MEETHKEIRIVVFQDGGKWVGQCLELDIGAQADDVESLLAFLEVAIKIDSKTPGRGPAPKHYFEMWDRCPPRLREVSAGPDMKWALCA